MLSCYNGAKLNSGSCEKYGKEIKDNSGSIIIMSFDLYNKTLSFNIDNIDYGIAFNNLQQIKYRFSVVLRYENDEIIILNEIINYQNNKIENTQFQ